ncbi:hypothetical protein GQ600_10823 [Phytophthora cactorum]|nr:hypothetical protein GQ600_10823 [Phytophthora cactorum]
MLDLVNCLEVSSNSNREIDVGGGSTAKDSDSRATGGVSSLTRHRSADATIPATIDRVLEQELKIHKDEVTDLTEKVQDAAKEELEWVSFGFCFELKWSDALHVVSR